MVPGDKGLKGSYTLAEVVEALPQPDGKVRKVSLRYKSYKPGEPISKYNGAADIIVTRAVQRVALIVENNQSSEDGH